MAWIESHQSLARHPKLIRLAATLGIHKCWAIGHLHCLWWWALDYAPDGDLSAFSPPELAEAAEWTGDSEKLVTALRTCGWIDEDGSIHDWDEYGGRYLEKRAKDRERKRSVGLPLEFQWNSGGVPLDGAGTNQPTNQPTNITNQHNQHNQPTTPSDDACASSAPGANGKQHTPRQRRSPSQASPKSQDHRAAVEAWCDAWVGMYGAKYPFAARDGAAIKWMLGQVSMSELLTIFTRYLADVSDFVRNQRHPLSLLRSQFQRWMTVQVATKKRSFFREDN